MGNFRKVTAFMRVMGQRIREAPEWPSDEEVALRFELIDEEVSELSEAIEKRDLVGVADALTDILYVTYGAFNTFGFPADELLAEVHRSNMTKLGPNGKPVYREDGKVMKPPSYRAPNIRSVLDGHPKA
jgi:predicted HAD superfamily Cof-like phosphohydrolase